MKYYAVRRGRTPGIYNTWNECSKNVINFKGAEYKSFNSKEEAEDFMNNKSTIVDEVDIDKIGSYAFVDGSFNSVTNVYGCGGFLIDRSGDKEVKYVIQESGDDPEMSSMRNVSGELLGSMRAIEKAIELNLKEINIFYDYSGIEKWANGEWTRNKTKTQEYYEFCQEVKNKIKINFIKVKGHTGIPGNEEADILAKESVGII